MSAPIKNSDKKTLSQEASDLKAAPVKAPQQEAEMTDPPPANDQDSVHRPSPPYTEQLRLSQSKRAA